MVYFYRLIRNLKIVVVTLANPSQGNDGENYILLKLKVKLFLLFAVAPVGRMPDFPHFHSPLTALNGITVAPAFNPSR